jgi:anti-anti-sigma factor
MNADDGIVWFLRGQERDLGGVVVVTLEGRVSNATAPDLARLLARREGHGLRGLVLDLSGVDYINGAGLKVLAAGASTLDAAGCELIACNPQPVIHTIFDMAGPIPHLTIERSTEAALNRLLPASDQR